jgi:hypothetical protein
MIRATKFARRALAKSLRGWAVLPNPFSTAHGRDARVRWLTRYDALHSLIHVQHQPGPARLQ